MGSALPTTASLAVEMNVYVPAALGGSATISAHQK